MGRSESGGGMGKRGSEVRGKTGVRKPWRGARLGVAERRSDPRAGETRETLWASRKHRGEPGRVMSRGLTVPSVDRGAAEGPH